MHVAHDGVVYIVEVLRVVLLVLLSVVLRLVLKVVLGVVQGVLLVVVRKLTPSDPQLSDWQPFKIFFGAAMENCKKRRFLLKTLLLDIF